MGYYADAGSHRTDVVFPAYGPIDSVLSFVVFYIFVTRATPTIVDVFSSITGLSPSAIGFGLAGFLWFILVVTLLDVVRRQFAAAGFGSRQSTEEQTRQAGVPSASRAVFYLVVVLVGGVVAVWSFEPAVAAGIGLIRMVGTLDTGAFDIVGFLVMILFFVSFGAATRALDRLVIGGVRAVLS
ncbi:hypothetical protein [Haloferax sp. DFSO52]|uniref:hypothetical protein n=1 Tax=Haloferax sp. DFSO52 TaxID=3388505 RepID=UPI003A854C35